MALTVCTGVLRGTPWKIFDLYYLNIEKDLDAWICVFFLIRNLLYLNIPQDQEI